MFNRMRLLQGAAVVLYMGPLLAGLGGFGWSLVPVFAGIFVLWGMVLRPQDWPRDAIGWRAPGQVTAALFRVVMQLALVVICFGIGRGIGGILGATPLFNPILPVALSFLSIPLARAIWDPWKAEEMDRFLDDAIRHVEGGPDARHISGGTRKADGLLTRLVDLAADSPEDALLSRLRELERLVDPGRIADALLARAARDAAGPARMATMRLLAIFATDGRVVEMLDGDLPMRALTLLPRDPALITLFADRATTAMQEDPDMVWLFPDAASLAALAGQMAGTPAEAAVSRLCAVNARLAPTMAA